MSQLLAIENRHGEDAPELPKDGYRAYFENVHGEQVLFHQTKGEREGSLWHGDADFERRAVRRGDTDLILDRGERLWLTACWAESGYLRDEEDEATATAVADLVFEQLMMDNRLVGRFSERLKEAMERSSSGDTPGYFELLRAQQERFEAAGQQEQSN